MEFLTVYIYKFILLQETQFVFDLATRTGDDKYENQHWRKERFTPWEKFELSN